MLTSYLAIADKFGKDGVNAKAVNNCFNRMKKEPAFDLNNPFADEDGENGTGTPARAKKTPLKATSTPSKKDRGKKQESDDDENGEEVAGGSTPTPRKANINRVKTGRVEKANRGKKMIKTEEAEADEENLVDPTVDAMEADDAESLKSGSLGVVVKASGEEEEEGDFC